MDVLRQWTLTHWMIDLFAASVCLGLIAHIMRRYGWHRPKYRADLRFSLLTRETAFLVVQTGQDTGTAIFCVLALYSILRRL